MDRHINVRFYSPQYDFLGMADEATVIFTGRWHTYGQFEIYLDQMESYIQRGNRIIWDRDNRKNGIIEYINVADDGSVTIKGYTLLWLLSQRITVPAAGQAHLAYDDNVENIMYDLVQKNAVNCADPKRNFANLTCGTSQGRGQKLSYQTRYDGLLDCLSELSKYSMLGLSIRVDLDACKEVFEVLGGTDRSLAQDANPQVVFRRSYDNIEKEIYTYNDSNTKNCAYVAGQGEGAERQVRIVGDDFTGEDRREILIDARDIEDPEQLPARGETKLAEYVAEESFEVTALADEYGKRWTMGDRVTVIGENSGVSLDAYITEVEESWDETGYDVVPTFGNPVQTLGQEIASGGGTGGTTGSGSSAAGMGARGYSLQYRWQGTSLGVKREDESNYQYTDLKGDDGKTPQMMINSDGHLIAIYDD